MTCLLGALSGADFYHARLTTFLASNFNMLKVPRFRRIHYNLSQIYVLRQQAIRYVPRRESRKRCISVHGQCRGGKQRSTNHNNMSDRSYGRLNISRKYAVLFMIFNSQHVKIYQDKGSCNYQVEKQLFLTFLETKWSN